jgi:hypothetical protein
MLHVRALGSLILVVCLDILSCAVLLFNVDSVADSLLWDVTSMQMTQAVRPLGSIHC